MGFAASMILMIRPFNFYFNPQTAVNNSFQKYTPETISYQAIKEFDAFVNLLKRNLVQTLVIGDSPEPSTPDSVFPNNWISFHEDGSITLYPMFAANRRQERKPHVLSFLNDQLNISQVHDLSFYEAQHKFLEGTGSMVLDRNHKIAYASLSPRTDADVLEEFCRLHGYSAITFCSENKNQTATYHTNVMMCIADDYVVICLESVAHGTDKEKLLNSFDATKKEVIEISSDQLDMFAGNMLQVKNTRGELLLVMSTCAFESLNSEQVMKLEKYNRIIHSPLNTIETAGGGSARCMLAEIFNRKKDQEKNLPVVL